MQENLNEGRRHFLKSGLALVVSALALPINRLLAGSAPSVPAANSPVSESEDLAKAMGYVKDAAKADAKKFPKAAGTAGKTSWCKNCMFYGGKPTDKQAPCQIFQNRPVVAGGWCNSWAAKPKT